MASVFLILGSNIRVGVMMEEENSKIGKFLYNLIDAMFWVYDETLRWWEISKIIIQIKTYRRQKTALNKLIKENEQKFIGVTVAQTAELTSLNESISKLAAQEDFLKSKCSNWTPIVDFSIIFILFVYGIISINPIQNIVERRNTSIGVFGGQISRVRELPFEEHSIISDSIWFNNKLYIAGNNGVTEIDTVSGGSKKLKDLPENFYGKDLSILGNRLLIAGYPGIFEYENNEIKPFIAENKLPDRLINSFSVVNEKKKQFLFGTLGKGIYYNNGEKLIFIPKTYDYIAKSFAFQRKELWILHDEGILIGHPDKLDSLNLEVLAGKRPRCMITTDKNVFIGTDHGIIAGYRSSRNREWTMLSTTKPSYINSIINAGEILFIASNEGVFRYYKGKMDRLSSIPTHSLCLCDTFLAATGKSSVFLYYFDFSGNVGKSSIFGVVPELGTYTPTLPVTTLPVQNRPIYKRMPDYGLLETDGKEPLMESAIPIGDYSPNQKPMVELPVELQNPVFSDITFFNGKYYLATTNRGIWAFDGKNWSQVNNNSKSNANKLCSNKKDCYAYSSKAGIYKIIDDKAELIVDSKETSGLKYMSISDDDKLLLLFADGNVKIYDNKELKPFFIIPTEFVDNCHSIWKISEQYIAVLNQGVMAHEADGKWNLMFYRGNTDSAKIVDVCNFENKSLYIALNDGRIFEYSKNKLPLTGIVPDYPISINYSENNLWVSSIDSLYLKENNVFTPLSFKSNNRILGVFTDSESKNLLVFTASGLRVLPKQ